ncbi:hypothetical protein SAMN05216388_1009100 [Halorientalis persicus]|uniref:Uncharacterized protein n=1 Tax=Halorientalis persicus TaxID=1367881 RepID=A0A1H8MRQ5_9EURY|nr:hypothetical protein [Halorientalis persicus]SEO20102.1 hypothetical protein SAMN05216388_1009100 [Halorientalis persicus]
MTDPDDLDFDVEDSDAFTVDEDGNARVKMETLQKNGSDTDD